MLRKLSAVFIVLACGLAGFLLSSAYFKPKAPSRPQGPLVVATQSIFADWARQISAGALRVECIVEREGNVHHFEPKPSKAILLAQADLLIELGLGLEDEWLPGLYASSNSKATRLVLSTGLPALRAQASWDGHHHGHAPGPGRQQAPLPPCCKGKIHLPPEWVAKPNEEADPHLWMDIAYTRCMIKALCEAICALDPQRSDFYKKNLHAYDATLSALDAQIREKVKKIPEKNRILVTHHDSLRYFALAYGFFDLGNATGSSSSTLQEAPAGHIADLIDAIKKQKIPALFPEASEVPVLLEQLSRETGVPLAPPIYVGALSTPTGPASTYVALMQHLVDTFVEALKD